MTRLTICDSTLRDGNHAVAHQLCADDIRAYAAAADHAGVDVVEVGHGNGIGASSIQVGMAALSDEDMLRTAKSVLTGARLGVLSIPGFSCVERHLKPALDCGVDEVRVGAHCTEASLTAQQITLLRDRGVTVKGVLMMSHMASAQELLRQARQMQDYGAEAVILMDSAGAYTTTAVREKVGTLVEHLDVEIGFHAHNNLGLAVSNTMTAIEAGATIVDVTARGFGAGAGNTPLELVAANLHLGENAVRLRLFEALDAAELAESKFVKVVPTNDGVTITSGIAGVFSGFAGPTRRAGSRFGVDPRRILMELGRRRVVAGQEDTIVEVALALADEDASAARSSERPMAHRPLDLETSLNNQPARETAADLAATAALLEIAEDLGLSGLLAGTGFSLGDVVRAGHIGRTDAAMFLSALTSAGLLEEPAPETYLPSADMADRRHEAGYLSWAMTANRPFIENAREFLQQPEAAAEKYQRDGRQVAVSSQWIGSQSFYPLATSTIVSLRPGKIVDLGSGAGTLLATLLAALPGARGVALDKSPAACAEAEQVALRAGVGNRMTVLPVAIESLVDDPSPLQGADVVHAGFVLHDLANTPDVLDAVLRACHAALPPGARLVVTDAVPYASQPRERVFSALFTYLHARFMDVQLPTEQEWIGWLTGAGFHDVTCSPHRFPGGRLFVATR
jgi:4-hydroxy 2-oxovalerate aldolase